MISEIKVRQNLWLVCVLFALFSVSGCGRGVLEGSSEPETDAGTQFRGSAVLSIAAGEKAVESESYVGRLSAGSVSAGGVAESEQYRLELKSAVDGRRGEGK